VLGAISGGIGGAVTMTPHAMLITNLITALIIGLIVLVAALIRGLTGFGFAILAVPLLGLVIPPSQAVIFAIIMQMLIGPFGVPQAWPEIDRRAVAWIVGFAWISTPIGLWLLSTLPVEAARIIIAGIGLGCFFLFLIKRAPMPSAAPLHLAATGLASGLLNGFAAMPGPPVILYFIRDGVPPRVARGSMITVFAGTAIAGTIVAALRGMITRELIMMTALALPIMVAGNHIGARFFGKISERLWRGLVIALLLVAAMGAVARI
jgi:uncharacterized protein